jgi:hypothetical protein
MRRRPEQPGGRALTRWGALIGAALAAFVTVTGALAGFSSSSTGGPMSVSSKRIFPGVRSTSAWDIRDASGGGAETNSTDPLSYADSVLKTTNNWTTAFASNRWLEFDFNNARAGGVPISSAQFNFTFAAGNAGVTACFYFEVYRASSGTLLGTYGTSGTPAACTTGTTQQTTTTTVGEITNTDVLNDLRIRVYGRTSTNNRAMTIDLATVTATTSFGTNVTAFESVYRDQANGTLTTTNWSVATGNDSTNYQSVSTWATTFAAARYLKLTFSPDVPTGSVVTSATVDVWYRPNNNSDTVCWYMEVYNGATLIGTHGSSGTPISCKTGNATYQTDNVSIPEVNSVAAANNLVIKIYMKDSGLRRSQIDLAQANLSYYLD